MEFPHPFTPSPAHRAGRMLAAGRVKVTVTSHESGQHITVLFKSFADNRDRQYNQNVNKNWVECPYQDCTHMFVDVPPASGGWADKVGTYYPRSGRWYDADKTDPSRVAAAGLAAWWIQDPINAHPKFMFQEASECGVCGLELTDPESIARGIGPTCFGRMTTSQHQVKHTDADVAAFEGVSEDAPMAAHAANNMALIDVRTLKDEDLGVLRAAVEEECARRARPSFETVDSSFMAR